MWVLEFVEDLLHRLAVCTTLLLCRIAILSPLVYSSSTLFSCIIGRSHLAPSSVLLFCFFISSRLFLSHLVRMQKEPTIFSYPVTMADQAKRNDHHPKTDDRTQRPCLTYA
jgi:hypothetical protein